MAVYLQSLWPTCPWRIHGVYVHRGGEIRWFGGVVASVLRLDFVPFLNFCAYAPCLRTSSSSTSYFPNQVLFHLRGLNYPLVRLSTCSRRRAPRAQVV